ncbi:plasmid pRiA4b ORF-3 family protein [Ferruginibacter albus]|uniref:plasmid pRiA4b ORF-3 family protein n=1 Tax=Ferruginibacter albus TaxID=2875540 RepID=UPI001CC4A4E5|nr:plasmid pRiA4b ORF-3 family protein [Ferruginibacter albus]UAY51135.1 plasmid pRiA4b ORF-3 family protein [Ferruginibacter albus]
MAILRFRTYWEDDDSIYRDIAIRHTQTFADLHSAILKAYEFDSKHKATFYRSNDNWQRGREISAEKYDDHVYKVEPLIMSETVIGTEVKDPNQRFIYVYDFNKLWTFLVELINVDKEENKKLTYPSCIRTEGIAPSQYGTKGLVDSRLAEVEEKYDLQPDALKDGFGEEGEEDESAFGEEESAADESNDGF